jgi:uncharacterized protein YndB with AHSA1/START domain
MTHTEEDDIGPDIDRSAPVIVRDEIHVDAPVAEVWRLHTDVDGWTGWRDDVSVARLDGPFTTGAVFHWETGGLAIDSTIRAVEPEHRTLWGGPAAGIEGRHVWTFTREGDGTHVVTEESWSGPPVDADPEQARTMLAASIRVWLESLAAAAQRSG